jgi:transaldolase
MNENLRALSAAGVSVWLDDLSRRLTSGNLAALIAAGPLWASTGTKYPAYSDTLYISGLVAAEVVNTMPEKTLMAFADHGYLEAALGADATAAAATLAEITAAGVDLADG